MLLKDSVHTVEAMFKRVCDDWDTLFQPATVQATVRVGGQVLGRRMRIWQSSELRLNKGKSGKELSLQAHRNPRRRQAPANRASAATMHDDGCQESQGPQFRQALKVTTTTIDGFFLDGS